MKFVEEPGFVHTSKEPRYFVLCLDKTDSFFSEGYRYEIQFLNDDGEGGAVALLAADESECSVPGFDLPTQVIMAAFRQEKGSGDYVNSLGESVRPF